MDISIAITDADDGRSADAIERIARQVRECGIEAEFLFIGPGAPAEAPFPCGGLPARTIEAAGPLYGDFLRAARDAARGDWLITLDGPSMDDASLVFAFWYRRREAELLIASRYVFGGSAQMPWLRSLTSRWMNALYRAGLSVGVHDLSSSRRMYRTRVLRQVDIEGGDYDVLMETLLRFMSKGGRAVEVPWHYESKRHRQPVNALPRLFTSSLVTFRRLHALRNSVDFPDYDYRAYDSRIWFQRYWQRTRFRIVREFEYGSGLTLDAGCGTSRIVSTRPEMIAMDIKFSRLLFLATSNPRRLQATAGCLPFAAETFDTVISSQVIEHTPEDTCIRECLRVLKPGGTLILGTPDYGRIWWPIIEKIYGFVKRGGYADEHITHYTLAMLLGELRERGCHIEDYKYICGGELIIKATKAESPASA